MISFTSLIKQYNYAICHERGVSILCIDRKTIKEKEVEQNFDKMSGVHRLTAMPTYGCGPPLHECLSLRTKDVDLEQNIIIVRSVSESKLFSTIDPRAPRKGWDTRTIQELLGHKQLHTTIIYTHAAKMNILGMRSPLDG